MAVLSNDSINLPLKLKQPSSFCLKCPAEVQGAHLAGISRPRESADSQWCLSGANGVMFIPNFFNNVFFLVLVLFDVLDVGLSAGLGIDPSDPLSLSDPLDPSCLLTINATQFEIQSLEKVEEDDDYMKRWAESYLKEAATNAAKLLGHAWPWLQLHGDFSWDLKIVSFNLSCMRYHRFVWFVLRPRVYTIRWPSNPTAQA